MILRTNQSKKGGMPSSVIKSKQRYANMSDEELADRFKGADEKTLRQMAWRHGYGNMSSHYLDRVKNVMTGKRTATTEVEISEDPQAVGRSLAMLKYGKDMATAIINGGDPINVKSKAQAYMGGVDRAIKELGSMYNTNTNEAELEEGIKDWAKNLAMAGVIVAGLAGVNSINNAIDNSVPAIQAMNQALDSAEQRGDTESVAMIQKDLKGAKLRLDIGKDLNQVKYLQDKYKNFMPAGYKSEDKDDQNYPPHLQDLFKKLRDKQAQNKQVDAKVTDATPKGYGPKDDDAVNEYSPFKNKVLSKIAKPASDYAEKLKTLDMLARDPNTNRDPELQKELIRRKQQLITTKESSTVLYTNRLTDMMGKRLGESWANKFKTT